MKYETWLKRHLKNGTKRWPDGVPILGVVWEDATFHDGKSSDPEAATALAFTIGVVASATPKAVLLAHEVFADGTERGITTIPAGMVRDVKVLANLDMFAKDKAK